MSSKDSIERQAWHSQNISTSFQGTSDLNVGLGLRLKQD